MSISNQTLRLRQNSIQTIQIFSTCRGKEGLATSPPVNFPGKLFHHVAGVKFFVASNFSPSITATCGFSVHVGGEHQQQIIELVAQGIGYIFNVSALGTTTFAVINVCPLISPPFGQGHLSSDWPVVDAALPISFQRILFFNQVLQRC